MTYCVYCNAVCKQLYLSDQFGIKCFGKLFKILNYYIMV